MIGWIATLLNIIGLILLGRKHRIGWLFGIVAECLWIVRAGHMGMPDLVAISTVYVFVAAWNFTSWGKHAA